MLDEILDGKYRIDKQLGAGGMDNVYLATHLAAWSARPPICRPNKRSGRRDAVDLLFRPGAGLA